MTATLMQSPSDQYLILTGIGWEQLDTIETGLKEIEGLRFFYLDGNLEIMTISTTHEDYKKNIAYLLEAYLRASNIRFYGRGGPTLGAKELQGRKEPDESYNLGTKKDIPDLVIEIIVTSGGLDRLEFYQRIGVPEVWFWEDGVLKIYYLRQEYEQVDRSVLLPALDLTLLTHYLDYHDQYDAVAEFLKHYQIFSS